MARARKYQPGETITTVAEFATEIEARRYVYFHGKPLHPSWVGAWPFNHVAGAVRKGWFRKAEPNEAQS